ncbi:hypothetical protein GME_05095 [Halomonas sp. TD01]|nr:hypothetical protein GME_05095 [Halomonas sp. TD01]
MKPGAIQFVLIPILDLPPLLTCIRESSSIEIVWGLIR